MSNPKPMDLDAELALLEIAYAQKLLLSAVPDHLHGGLILYFVHRIQPGHFLLAVLQNDLMGAIARGDDESVRGIKALVVFLTNHAPGESWGSHQNVRDWLAGRRAAWRTDHA